MFPSIACLLGGGALFRGGSLGVRRVGEGSMALCIVVWGRGDVNGGVCPVNVRGFRDLHLSNCFCVSGATLVCRLIGSKHCCFLDHPHHFKGDLLVSALRTCFRKGGRLFRKLTVRGLRGS